VNISRYRAAKSRFASGYGAAVLVVFGTAACLSYFVLSQSTTWIESNQGDAHSYTQVDTQYPSGVNILTTTDTKIDYARLAEPFPGIAEVITLRGVPAMVIRQDTDNAGENPGSVALTLGNSRIVVMGHYPASDLEGIVDGLS